MNNTYRMISRAIALCLAAGLGSTAHAADVYLRATSFQKAVPTDASGTSTQPVTMWGYSSCDSTFTNCSAPDSPGPQITVPVGESTLTIHLQNMLADDSTSIMIPGQTKPMVPQTVTDALGRTRVRAFDLEAAAGGGTQDYVWNNLRPGTYLYQSASHVQLQVQMGLYGVMAHDHAPPPASTTAVAVTNAGFEAPDCDTTTCTIDPVRGNYTTSAAGWTVTGGSGGVFDPLPTIIVPTEGDQVGWSSGATLAQVTGEAPAANTTYTLSVDVGDRTDSGFPGYTIALYSGATLLAQTTGAAGSVTSGWAAATLSYMSGATPPTDPLQIRLTSAGSQTEFDNVRLVRATTGPCDAAPCAYPGVAYDRARTVIFSEIDPTLHDPAPKAANLTVDGYRPSIFLVNGQPYVNAKSLAVSNAGFEAPDCDSIPCVVNALGNYTNGVAAGWTVTGAAGVFDPVSVITPTEGDQVGYSSGGTLSQVLGASLDPDTSYTLSVDVGDRSDAGFPGYTVGLYAGGTLLAESVGAPSSVTSGWTTSTVSYASGATPPSGPIEIRLRSQGSQTEFDNVRLFASQATTAPVVAGSAALVSATPGERILLRLVNAGLQNRAPQLLNGYFEIIGEDGHAVPVRRTQYNTLLPAGKSLDVLFTPTADGTYPLYDRRLGLDNGSGQLGHIVVGP